MDTIDYTKLSDDRLPLDFHEGDENGYIYTPSGGAEGEDYDGKALYVGAVIYVEYPEHTLESMREDDDSRWYGWTLTEQEQRLFPAWLREQYPKVPDWVDSGDDRFIYADFTASYKQGETTEQLLYRLCVMNPAFTEIRNDWEILFNGFNDFMEHVRELREKRAEEFWYAEYVEDDMIGWASDASSDYGELAAAPYVVVIKDDQDRSWLAACKSDKEIAQQYAGCMVEDNQEWVDGVYHFATGEQYEIDVTTTITVSVNTTEYTLATGA
jgi:hypothetical protein